MDANYSLNEILTANATSIVKHVIEIASHSSRKTDKEFDIKPASVK